MKNAYHAILVLARMLPPEEQRMLVAALAVPAANDSPVRPKALVREKMMKALKRAGVRP